MAYNGFQLACGCHCVQCGSAVVLEGFCDADGSHYCGKCDDYVTVNEPHSARGVAHSSERIRGRQTLIDGFRAKNPGEC